jgi:uncharacterized protein
VEEVATIEGEKPLWRPIVDFPLVAMLIATALVIGTIAVAILISTFLVPHIPGLSHTGTMQLIAIPLLVIVYKLGISRLGWQPRDDLRTSGALRLLATGLGAGLILFSAAVAIAGAIGIYRVLGEGDGSDLLDALVGAGIFAALSEEMLFRGILFRWLEEFGGSWTALLLTAALFGAMHLANPHASPIAAVGIAFEAGIMLGAAYMLTRSLWLPMGIHAAWNFAQGEIYDIPVSGTPVHGLLNARLSGPPLLTGQGFGLEASVIAMALATIFGVWLLWLAVRRGQVMQPFWLRRGRLQRQTRPA